ncbi:MAG: DUF2605 domain-containing protein [Cyanobacteria bacterium P01_D01_bin.36]
MATSPTPSEDADLLKSVLPPLLKDFRHWFDKTIDMLDSNTISFLTVDEKDDLRSRIQVAMQQVSASQALASATDSQAGIEMPVVMGWHKLVHECWGVALRLRRETAANEKATGSATGLSSNASMDAPLTDPSEQSSQNIPEDFSAS